MFGFYKKVGSPLLQNLENHGIIDASLVRRGRIANAVEIKSEIRSICFDRIRSKRLIRQRPMHGVCVVIKAFGHTMYAMNIFL